MRTSLQRRRSPLRKGSIFERRSRIKRTVEDDLFSKYIRLRDPVCRYHFRCLGARSVEASHIFGRGKGSVRFDEDNVYGACWACHRWADEHKSELEAFAKKTLGEERFNRLLVRSHLTAKQAGIEPVAIRRILREKIKVLQGH